MSTLECMIFSGLGGVIMMSLLGIGTIIGFIVAFYYRRFVSHVEKRHPRVFFYDLFKMLAATTIAASVNYTFTAKVSLAADEIRVRGKKLEGVGWYAAITTMDVMVGAPVALLFGRGVNYCCRFFLKRLPEDSIWYDLCDQNCVYGRYGDSHEADNSYEGERPPIRFSWWYSQTVTWTACTVLSGIASGLFVLYIFILVRSARNPVAWIAVSVSYWNVDCLLKQWAVVLFGRIVLTYLQLTLVDFFNKFKASSAVYAPLGAPHPHP